MKNRKIILNLLFVSLLFASACKDEDTVDNIADVGFFNAGDPILGDNEGYNLMAQYDKPNLMGLIKFESLYQDEYIFEYGGNGTYTPYVGETFHLSGEFANQQRSQWVSLLPAYVVANAFQMTEISLGKYYVPSKINVTNYFGNGYNKVTIDSNQYFGAVVDSVAFNSAVRLTNIPCGKVINRKEDFVINYTGATAGALVEYTLTRIRDFEQPEDPDSTRVNAMCNMYESTGTITVHRGFMSRMKTGYYTLLVTVYEPKYIPLSNGSEICMLGVSDHKTTVKIEDGQ